MKPIRVRAIGPALFALFLLGGIILFILSGIREQFFVHPDQHSIFSSVVIFSVLAILLGLVWNGFILSFYTIEVSTDSIRFHRPLFRYRIPFLRRNQQTLIVEMGTFDELYFFIGVKGSRLLYFRKDQTLIALVRLDSFLRLHEVIDQIGKEKTVIEKPSSELPHGLVKKVRRECPEILF